MINYGFWVGLFVILGNSVDFRLVKIFIEFGFFGGKLDFLMFEKN